MAPPATAFREALCELFCSYFTQRELLWLLRGFDNRELAASLPSEDASIADIARVGCESLERHGYLQDETGEIFDHLFRARPRLKESIDHLYALWRRTNLARLSPKYDPPKAEAKCSYLRVTLKADLGKVAIEEVQRIVEMLQAVGGNTELTIESIVSGSMSIVFVSKPTAIYNIKCALRASDTGTIAGFAIAGVEDAAPYPRTAPRRTIADVHFVRRVEPGRLTQLLLEVFDDHKKWIGWVSSVNEGFTKAALENMPNRVLIKAVVDALVERGLMYENVVKRQILDSILQFYPDRKLDLIEVLGGSLDGRSEFWHSLHRSVWRLGRLVPMVLLTTTSLMLMFSPQASAWGQGSLLMPLLIPLVPLTAFGAGLLFWNATGAPQRKLWSWVVLAYSLLVGVIFLVVNGGIAGYVLAWVSMLVASWHLARPRAPG